MADLEAIRQQYLQFAERECLGYSDLYYRLALGVAGDEAILRFIARRPVTQPNLFFAAIQFIRGVDGMPANMADLQAVLSADGAAIADVMQTHRTQTNEIGRCAVIAPALPSGPIALVEVGTSAGLCLLLDRFFVDYGETSIGPHSSPVKLTCALRGANRFQPCRPQIAWRRGLDVAPVDVRDHHAAQWLLACVWADHPLRRQRLIAAIDMARASPPTVVRGDLVTDLLSVVDAAPPELRLVVLHSAVLPYVDPDRRAAFAEVLADISTRREVVWISNEAANMVSRLEADVQRADGLSPPDVRFLVGRTTLRQRVAIDEVLAVAHPHGAELMWLGETG